MKYKLLGMITMVTLVTVFIIPIFASSYALSNTVDMNSTNATSGNTTPVVDPNCIGSCPKIYPPTTNEFCSNNQESSPHLIIVKTDKSKYRYGDMITILGSVRDFKQSNKETLFLWLHDNKGVVEGYEKMQVQFDGTFSESIMAENPNNNGITWTKSSLHNVEAVLKNSANQDTSCQFFSSFFSVSNLNITSTSSSLSPIPTIQSAPTNIPSPTVATPSKIPSWVKHIFIFYGQGQVSEDELLSALKFLIQQGILKI